MQRLAQGLDFHNVLHVAKDPKRAFLAWIDCVMYDVSGAGREYYFGCCTQVLQTASTAKHTVCLTFANPVGNCVLRCVLMGLEAVGRSAPVAGDSSPITPESVELFRDKIRAKAVQRQAGHMQETGEELQHLKRVINSMAPGTNLEDEALYFVARMLKVNINLIGGVGHSGCLQVQRHLGSAKPGMCLDALIELHIVSNITFSYVVVPVGLEVNVQLLSVAVCISYVAHIMHVQCPMHSVPCIASPTHCLRDLLDVLQGPNIQSCICTTLKSIAYWWCRAKG